MSENVLLFIAKSSLRGQDWKSWLGDHKIVGGFEIEVGSTEILFEGLNGVIVLARNVHVTDSVPSKPVHPPVPPIHFQFPGDPMSYLMPLADMQFRVAPGGFESVGAGESFNDASLLADEGE
jgi:hypothetical protein